VEQFRAREFDPVSTPPAVLLARMFARSRLRQWQLVQEVAALGSLQRGADAVGMSQPAATHALLELERLLGFPLFERHAKGVRLTRAGETVLPRVRAALHAFGECAEVMSDMLSGSSGELRVGTIGAGIGSLVSDATATFSRSHPSVVITVLQQSPELLLQSLNDHTIDIAIARRPRQLPAQTSFEDLLTDRYAIVCSPRHPLAGRSGVTREQLAGHLWLTAPKSTIADRDFDAFWVGTAPPTKLCWVQSRAVILMLSLLEQRQALVMIPKNTVRPLLATGTLAEVPGAWGPPIDPLGMLCHSAALKDRGLLADLANELRRLADLRPTGQP
jgi:DNA-binding transcriptional LysR family regulator